MLQIHCHQMAKLSHYLMFRQEYPIRQQECLEFQLSAQQ